VRIRKRHIALKPILVFIGLFFLVASCGNSKEVQATGNTKKRAVFKENFHKAMSEKMIGHYDKSISILEACLTLEPENPAVHFALSDLYESTGNRDKMISAAENAYQYDPSNKWYILRLADLYFAQERYEKTVELYAKIIEEEKNIDLKFQYIDALMRAKEYQKAIDMLNEVEVETGTIPQVSFTKHDLYVKLGEPEKAELEVTRLLTENPSDLDYRMMVAEYYMSEQRFDESMVLLQTVIDEDPDFGQAYIMQADLLLRQNFLADSFKKLKIGFSKDDVPMERKLELIGGLMPYTQPGQADADFIDQGIADLYQIIYDYDEVYAKMHEYYGYYLLAHDSLEKAQKELAISTQIDPSKYNVWIELTYADRKLARYDELFAHGEEMITYFPAQPFAYLVTGMSAIKLEKFDRAEELLFIGKDLVVDAPEVESNFYTEMAKLKRAKGDGLGAIKLLDKAINTDPKNLQAYDLKAEILMDLGSLSKAEECVKEGLSIDAKNSILLTTLAEILALNKKYAEAEEVLQNALIYDDRNVAILAFYGDILALNNKLDQALEFWKEAKRLGAESTLLDKKIADKKYYAE
jgi:tetratricopeptide (TPR) repeat protein